MTALTAILFLILMRSEIGWNDRGTLTPPTQAKTIEARWLIAHTPENARLVQHARDFSDSVFIRTKGLVKFNLVFPPAKARDGNNFDFAVKEITENKVQISQIGTGSLSRLDDRFRFFDLPFLFQDNNHVAEVVDGEVGQKLKREFVAKVGTVRPLAFTYSGGFRVYVSNEPIRTIGDLKGMKLVVNRNLDPVTDVDPTQLPFDQSVRLATLRAFDVATTLNRTPIVSELDLFRSGDLELSEDHYSHYTRLIFKFGLVPGRMQYVTESHHSVFLTSIVVNELFFQSLPQSARDVIADEAQRLALREREDSVESDQRAKDWLIASGFHVSTISPELRAELMRRSDVVREKFADVIGRDLIDKTRAARPKAKPVAQR